MRENTRQMIGPGIVDAAQRSFHLPQGLAALPSRLGSHKVAQAFRLNQVHASVQKARRLNSPGSATRRPRSSNVSATPSRTARPP